MILDIITYITALSQDLIVDSSNMKQVFCMIPAAKNQWSD